jgi:nitroreductase
VEFYEVIDNRKSIKEFKNNQLDKNKMSRIFTAAMMSPSWKNKTSYKFLLIDDENAKDQIADCILNDDNEASNAVKAAPAVVIIASDPAASGIVDDREYYLVDSAVAMEHLVLAATAEGYGTCWVGAVDEDRIREILNIPKSHRVVAMTPIGEIAKEEQHKPSKNMKDYIFHNGWNNSYKDIVNTMKH